jgi:hypothetical protein
VQIEGLIGGLDEDINNIAQGAGQQVGALKWRISKLCSKKYVYR